MQQICHALSEQASPDLARRTHELALLNDITLSATQLLDLQHILDFTLDTVVNRLGMQAGYIRLFDEETGRFTTRATRGVTESQCQEFERRRTPGMDISEQVARTGQTFFAPDMSVERRFDGLWEEMRGRSYVTVPLVARDSVPGTLVLVSYAGQPLSLEDIPLLQTLGNIVGIAINNALLLARTRRREQEATSLYQLSTLISASLDLHQVLNAVAEGACRALTTDAALVALVDDRREVVVKATSGTLTQRLGGVRIAIGEGPLACIFVSDEPVFLEGACIPDSCPGAKHLLLAEGFQSLLAMALKHRDRHLGLVAVMERQPRRFSKHEIRLFKALVQQVAITVENAKLFKQVGLLAALEERDRLAREMHDNLAHALGFLNLKASIAEHALAAGQTAQVQDSLHELRQVAKKTYTDIREAIFNLRTVMPPGTRLLTRLREYLEEYRIHFMLDAQLSIESESLAEFSPDVSFQIIRIIQEALTNVRRHSSANRIVVRFEPDGARVKISIEDNGQGYDLKATMQGGQHYGLQIMRERAQCIGGELEFDSQPGQGTRLVLRVPRVVQE